MFNALFVIIPQILFGFLVNFDLSPSHVQDISPVGKSAGKCKQRQSSIVSIKSCEYDFLDVATSTPHLSNSFIRLLSKLTPPSDSYHWSVLEVDCDFDARYSAVCASERDGNIAPLSTVSITCCSNLKLLGPGRISAMR